MRPAHDVPGRRIARPVPLRESAYEAILEMIVSRSLPPGRHLVENELAVTLGVSRQPVREALQALSNDGWVTLRPGHGAFVHNPNDEEADQLLAVRGLLESESARLAALHATEEGVAQLREVCERGTTAWEQRDVPTMVATNTELHALVMRLAGNKVLLELAAQVDRRVQWYYTPVARHRGGESWKEHAELIDAIAAGDADRAGAVMRAHTEQTRRCYFERKAAGELGDDPDQRGGDAAG
jgi:DNA-binding GntR family transcriptional regulator